MNIYLVGFMGCGKSFWGKALARELSIPFFDLDAIIEDMESQPIMDIFYDKGEEAFRRIERTALLETIENNQQYVISCGGGTPCFFDNMDVMNRSGKTFYLQASEQFLFERLRYEKLLRPLIHEFDNRQLKDFIQITLQQRAFFYKKAQYIINAEQCNLHNFTEIITNV